MKGHFYAGLFVLSLLSTYLFADETYTADLNIQGEVILPPCVINSGDDININFGSEVVTTRVDTGIYIQPVPYTVVCETPILQDGLVLTFTGAGATFNADYLQTSAEGLAVKFVDASDAEIALNGAGVDFFYSEGAPELNAVLEKDPAVTLSGGAFNATATLAVEYQ